MFKSLWCAGATRRYWVVTAASMMLFIVAMSMLHLARGLQAVPPRIALALLPVLAIVPFVVVEVQRIRRTDELRQRVECEAAAIAIVVSFLVVLALAFLQEVGVMPASMLPATLAIPLVYGGAQVWAHRRYR